MSYTLFVGDIFEDLATAAKIQDSSAQLFTTDMAKNISSLDGTYYMSLADINDPVLFTQICSSAKKIFYHTPAEWSDIKLKKFTELVLWRINQHNPVQGLDFNAFEKLLMAPYRVPNRIREEQAQLWTVGCSITEGVAVETTKSWSSVVAKDLNIPYTNVGKSGSSITWAADVILKLPVRAGDLIFWGLTSHPRLTFVDEDNDRLIPGNHSIYSIFPSLKEAFPPEILTSKSLIYHNVMAIKNICNFCDKLKVRLVILGLCLDIDAIYKTYQIKNFKQYLHWPDTYIDFGTDGQHPGPKTHQDIAKNFISLYHQLYPANGDIE